jgi:hypothetical protein
MSNIVRVLTEENATPEELQKIQDRDQQALATATDRAWEKVRRKRNELLRATDWAILPDSPHDAPNVRSYRQALRNLPQNHAAPEDVVWPANPMES